MPFRIRALVWPLALAAAAVTCSSDDLTLPDEGLPAAMSVVVGGGQTAVVATTLPDSLTVRVIDSESRPVEGIKVVFSPILGGGDAVPDTGLTNADGRTGTRWLLGTTAGAQRVQAMVVGATSAGALTQNFDATALAAPADTIFAARGDGQSAEVGAALTDSLVVKITDQYGNAVSGGVVTWAPMAGGTVSPASSTTGTAGTAATRRTLGAAAGPQGATATAAGLKGSPVVFTMTALPASPASLIKDSGDNQTAAAGSAVAESLVVRLLDASGNGVPGRNVTFAIATGAGSTSPTSATTDANGRAATRWTLGATAGGNSLIASSSGFSVTFQATGGSAAATTLLANSVTIQTDTAGQPVAAPPSVRVTDANGNPVAGVSVAFSVTGGGGSILPVTPIATNASGVATLTAWTLAVAAGPNEVTATAAGLTGSPLVFSANGVAGTAAQLQVQTQPSPSAQSGVALAVQPAVRLADVFGNPVTTTGAVVTAALATGGGTLGGTLTASTVGGVATFTNLSITGPTGAYTIRFTSGALTPDTTAAVTIGAGTASRLAMVTQPSTTVQNAVVFAQQPRVQVQDAAGNAVAGVRSVAVAISSGGGVLGGTATINTDAAGLATFAGLAITGTTGGRTLVFSGTGLTSVVSGTVTITAGAPTQMAVNAGNGQSATAGSTVAIPPSVVVRDVSGNPVSGVSVAFAVASGGGSVLPVAPVLTNASGVAAASSWTLGVSAGANTLTADAAPVGIAGDPVTFTATAVSGGAGGLGIVTQPAAAAVNGVALTQAPVIQLQDVNSNPVATAGIAISVAIASGPGGTLGGPTTVATDANGRATFGGLSITGLAGAYTLQFTGASLTGVMSTTVTLSAGAATQVEITTGPPAGAQSGVAMAPATVVQLQDLSGNAVGTAGVNIAAALVSGGGTLTGTLTVPTAAGGASTFDNLILAGTAGPRVIRFTSAGLTPDTSTVIALGAGTASALEYVVQPSTVTAGQNIAPAVTVRVRDGAGNTVTTATNAVTMAIGINPAGSTLTGTLTANAVAGVATFGALSLNKAGAGYTLVASATGLTSATSSGFTVNSAGATTIAANSVTSQTDTAGMPAAAPPSVLATDANGNPVAGVSVTFAMAGGGGSILPVTPVLTNAAGVATLTSWTLGNVAGANTVTASVAGLTGSPVTFTATGVAGIATQLVIQTQPSSAAQSGVAFAVQPAVRSADVFGNTVPATGTVVTATLAAGTGTLGGTLTANTAVGVATFTNLSIVGATGAYTIQFTSGALTPTTSTAITIGAGAPTKLAMGTQPSTTAINGVAFPVQPSVQLQDAANNPVAQSGVVVTATISTGNPALGGTLTATTDAGGLATFTNLAITGAVGARTLLFTSPSLTQIVSGTVTTTAGAATQIAINTGDGQVATAGSAVATPPAVVVRDVSGNPVPGVAVTFAVASGGGSVLPSGAVTTSASGIAAATSWTLGPAAGPNTLTADAAPAGIAGDPVTFTATGVSGGAGKLGMVTQPPAAAVNGVVFSQAPVIQLQDVNGNPVTTAGITITAAIGSGPGGTLGGDPTQPTDVNGRATFPGLTITGLVGAYTLQFTGVSLTGVTSTAVTLSAGAATKVTITTEPPATAQSGIVIAPATVAEVQDVSGNLVNSTAAVTAAIASGGGTLSGTVSTAAVGGIATFSNLIVTGTIGARTLSFASAGLTPDVSTAISLTAGNAASVAFVQEPTAVTAGAALTPAPTVQVLDGAGNLVTTPAQTVALTISTNPGGATLSGVTSVATVSGLATFTGLSLNRSGTGYRLRAAAGALVPDTSAAFNVTAAAATTIAANSATAQTDTAGLPAATPPSVLVTDANANPVAGVSVTFAVTGGGSILPVSPVVTNAAGIATLTAWTLGNVAGANTVTAAAAGLTGSPATFTATGVAGVPTQLQMVTQPSPAAQSGVALGTQPAVRLADAFGNAVPTAGTTVTAQLGSGSGTLGGTLSAVTVGGVATFTNLAITGPTGAYTLQFLSTGLTSVTSASIAIGAGAATKLAMSSQPSTTAVNGVAFATQPAVQLQDAANNPVAQAGVVVTAAISTGGGTLGGTVTATTNAGGLATFTNLAITGTVGPRTLVFTSGALTQVVSGTVTTTAGAATQIAINAGNGQTATVNTAVATPPSVLVRDVSLNPVAGVSVTFAVATGGGSILPVSPVVTNASGIAALTSWTLGNLAGANSVTAIAAGLTGSPLTFTATGAAGAATQLVIQTQPSAAAQSGVAFAVQPVVRLGDAFGNLVNTGGTVVTAALATGTGTLGGTLTASTVAGVATFTNLAITGVSGAYTLRFTSGALTPDTTTAITIGAGAGAQLAMAQQPSTTAQNAVAFVQQPTVQLQDAAGNPVAQAGVVVTAAIQTGGGTLGGTLTATTNAAGLATFTNLSITGTIGPRTLVFTSGALTQVISGTVTTTAGAATQIAINAGNGQSATVNTAVATAPSAVVRDVSGNPVAGVSVSFGVAGGGGSILPVTPIVTNASGVAALTSWTMGTAAGANSITATSGTLVGSPVTFTATGTAGAATQLQVATQPSPTVQSGVALAVQPAIRLADAFGNPVATSGTVVTAAIGSGTGTLGGTLTATTVSGVATFTNLAISGTAGVFTLGFTAPGVTGVSSATITLGAGAASRLAVVVQPSASAQNAIAFPQQPQVQVQDASGNPVAGVASVGVVIQTGGGVLGGTTPVNTNAAGLATFAGLSITGTVGARTLQFTSAGLTSVTSATVGLTAGVPTQMAVNAGQAQTATAGSAVAVDPSVVVRDVSGNPVPGVSVTFAVASGGGSVLPGTPVATDASGIATATSWTLGAAAGANSLTATAAPGGIAGNPVTFTATGTAGAAGKLAMFTQPPASAQSGLTITPAVVVQLQDINGNPIATSGFGVTASIASGPGGTLGPGNVALTDASGRATFNGLTITGPTGSYTLQFNGASVTGVNSNALTLTAGGPARVTVTAQPTTAQSGIAFPSAPTVQVEDAAGNPVTGAGRNVVVTLLAGGGALSGTTNQATNASGVASFPGLAITGTIGPRTLLFSSAGIASDTTAAITLTPGTATQLQYLQQPTTVVAGQVITPSPTVRIRDGAGNTVTTATNAVTMALASNPGPSTLGGTTTVSAVAGVATFSTLTLNRSATGYTLAASATGLTGATSAAFTVNPGTATALAVTTAPTTGQSGVVLSPQPVVRLVDVNGNTVPTSGTQVTATLASGAGTLGGTLAANTVNGVATFTNLALTGTTGAYTINFSSPALTSVTTGSITLSAGAPAALAFQVQPSTVASSSAVSPAVMVRVLDGAGNLVPTATNSIVIGLGANPGGAALSGTTTVAAVAGVASFSTLSLDKVGTGYTLAATSAGLTGATSSAFNVTPGAATKLVYAVQPSTVTAGAAVSPAVIVQIQDAASNLVTTATNAVTLAIATNPGSSTLGGTATVSAVAGVATFGNLSLNKTGTGYTLAASSGALTGATSSAFTVNPGTATALAVTSQPTTGQSGVMLVAPLVVRLVDANGNTVPSNGVIVNAGLASGGGVLSGTVSTGTVSGSATFTNLVLTGTTGNYTLNLSSGALTSVTTGAIALSAGAPAALAFQVQPTNAASGAAITPAVTVRVLDSAGNLVPTATNQVTISIGSNPGLSTLGGTATVNAVAGVATFGNLSLDKVGSGYTLAAAAGGLTGATSGAFAVTPGAATKLVYSGQPSAVVAGVAISPAVVIQIQDANNNVVTGSTAAVSLALAANPGGSTLGGTTTVNAVAGVATLSTLTLNKAAAGYTLAASSGILAGATSTAFTVNPGIATALAITTAPTTGQSGAVLSPQPVIRLVDANGNTVPSNSVSVTAALASGSGTLGGVLTALTTSGVASFSSLALTGTAGSYTINFSAAGLTAVTSGTIALGAGAPAALAYQVQPSTVVAGALMAPAVQVRVVDGAGNTVPTATNAVTLALGANPGGSALGGTLTAAAAAGVASFSTLTLNKAAAGYTLAASAAGLTGATSTTFSVNPGAAASLVISTAPTTAQSGIVLSPQPAVRVVDANGNTVTGSGTPITVALASGAGTIGGTLTANTVSGVATFTNLAITGTVGSYTLGFSAPSLTGVTSGAIALSAGSATALDFQVQPTTTAAGSAISPALQVRIVDGAGNLVTTATNTVAIALGANPGPSTLGGTTSAAAAAGVATFGNLTLNRAAAGYTLVATTAGLAPDTTAAFTVIPGAAAALAITTAPTTGQSGATLSPQPVIRVVDGSGNTVTGSSATVTAALASGAGTLGGTLFANAVSGVATFANLALTGTAGNYTINFTSGALASVTTGTITLSPGAPAALAFQVQPTDVAAGAAITPAVTVRVLDGAGNFVPTATNSLSMGLGANPGGSVLGGTTTVSAVAGVATFSTLTLGKTGAGYTLAATSGGLTGATSSGFAVTPGAANRVVFLVQPTTAAAGAAINPAPQVEIQDANGNRVTGSTAAVTLALGSNPGGSTLSGTATVNAVAGVATFSTLSLNRTGTGYTLGATSGALTGATSAAFNINPGAATALAITTAPTTGQSGVVLSPQPVIRLVDANGNTVPTTGTTVSAALASGSGTLGGTLTANTSSGLATFSNLALTGTAGAYTLNFSAGGLTPVTSGAITLSAGAPAAVAFLVQPSTVTAGALITPAVQVRVMDGAGNTVTTATNSVTLSLATNPGGSALGGTLTAAAVGGVATFSTLTLDRAAAGYALSAASTGLTPGTSTTFTVNPGVAAALVINTAPTTAQSGVTLAPQPAVRLVDALGNTVPTTGTTVTAALASGGGTLGGTLTANTVSGVATFTNLALTGTIGNYTLTFTAPAVTGVTSGPIAVAAGAPAAVEYLVQPSTVVAGALLAPAVQVRVRDGAGNTVTTATDAVTLALGANPGGSTLGGTTTVAAVAGVATFGTLTLNRSAAGYTLTAASTGLTGDTSVAFTVNPGAASALAITTAPATGQSGVVLSPQPVVRLVDANGNTVPTTGTLITAALASGSGTLGGTLTASTVSGVATFANLQISGTVGNFTISFTSGALTAATTGAIAISAGVPAALAYTQQPSTSIAGANITPTVQVRVLDGAGNLVSTATTSITLTIGTNPGAGVLGGTTTQAASGGTAAFPGLSINRTGSGYTLLANGGGLTQATSTAFDITPAAASALAFTVQPGTTVAGVAIAPAVQVEVRDALGNRVTSSTASITVAIGTNPGGSTLGGTTTVSAVAGVATFSTLSLNRSGAGYTLSASAGGLTSATSAGFTVDPGAAAALAITTMPPSAQSGALLSPQPVIRVVDALGNTVPANGIIVTAAIASGTGTLGGTLTASTVAGVATFANLSLAGAAGNFTLNFSSVPLTSVTSGALALGAGAPAALAFQVQPTTVVSGAAITPAVQVRVIDGAGNLVTTATNSVTIGLSSNPVAGVLGGTLSVAAVGGVATFSTLTLDRAGVGYALSAASGVLTGANSSAFDVTAGAASKLAFFVQPTTAAAATGISPAVQVEVQDAAGNRVTTATTSITLTIGNNPGTSTLGGTSTVSAAAGVVAFPGISLNKTGTGYTLVANGGGLTAATSAGFDITPGVAAALAFTTQPSAVVAGVVIAPAVVVEVRDASGNRVTSATTPITLAFGNNAGGATLGGAGPVSAVAGVATFSGVTLNRTGAGYTLTATGGALPLATSAAFTVNPAAPAALIFSSQPTSAFVGAAIAPAVTVRIEDALGNLTASTATVALALGNNPSGATLGGTTSLAAVAGVATFANLTLNRSGATYTLISTSAGLAPDTSSGFTIVSATTSATIITDLPDPSVTGQPVLVNYSVISGGGTPTGSVTVSDGTASCVGTVAAGNCSLVFATIGAKTITATYSGDANFSGSASAGTAHTVNQAATTTVFGVQNPNPSTRGQPVNVTWAVQVTAPGTGAPTGNVTVTDGVDSCTAAVAAVSCNVTLTTVGSRPLTLTYAGDANYGGSSIGSIPHTVNPAASTTTITSDTPDPSVAGQSVSVAYTVTSAGGTPTGNVTVSDGLGASCVGTVGASNCALTLPTAGARTLTATYAGDGNFVASASAGVAHAVNQAATTTAIATHTPDPSPRGSAVSVTWTVTPTAPGAGTPTGNVTVSDGVNTCVAAVGLGGCSVTLNTVGVRSLTASYAGDANFVGSGSVAVNHTVTLAPTTTAITSDSPDPSVTGELVTVAYTVTSAGGTPTGNVTVSDGVGGSCVATVAAGSCSITFATAGARTLTATYAGDANFAGSASAGASHLVSQAATTTTITGHSPDPSTTSTAVSVSWTVLPTAPGAGTPTGTVTVTDGVDSCNAAVAAGGCSLTLTTSGARVLVATYAGDTEFTGSSSTGTAHQVN